MRPRLYPDFFSRDFPTPFLSCSADWRCMWCANLSLSTKTGTDSGVELRSQMQERWQNKWPGLLALLNSCGDLNFSPVTERHAWRLNRIISVLLIIYLYVSNLLKRARLIMATGSSNTRRLGVHIITATLELVDVYMYMYSYMHKDQNTIQLLHLRWSLLQSNWNK